MAFLIQLLAIAALTVMVLGYPEGAPNRANVCMSMKPDHQARPSTLPPPFTIEVSKDNYKYGETLQVTIKGEEGFFFKGFLIQARRADWRFEQSEPIGYFNKIDGTKNVCTGLKGNGLTHTGGEDGSDTAKNSITLTWTANKPTEGHIQFWVTVVSSFDTYWVGEPSEIIFDTAADPIPTKESPTPPSMLPSRAIELATCGTEKGCYREPDNCLEKECEAVVTWVDRGAGVDFELSGDKEGWVALGFSKDKFMGDDSVVECVWNPQKSQVEVRVSFNEAGKHVNRVLDKEDLGLSMIGGSMSGGRVKCQFRRVKALQGEDELFDLDEEYHILIAKGDIDENGNKAMHSNEPLKFPLVSPGKVRVPELVDISGRARYPLVKLHGCLMLMAWMMSASLAILLAKYYKPMWPNDRVCSARIWFALHRALMIVTAILTIIAFIVIFLHVGGYSKMPELPAKAHPPLGITVTILVILNPLLALCRCKDGHTYRPIFNWIHWFIGTVAFVLQAPTLFIGLSLPKAFVPWWATWVMVAFMLFHIIIELLLEIHGCLNARKQRKRSLEYQLASQTETKGSIENYEPQPVGTRFKSIIIALYIFVMILLGLVMVITVAVC